MSDGGYSRIEKDFLGNERMVHYDAAGNMLGASDVIREEDGTIRISNDLSSPTQPDPLPKIEIHEPVVRPVSETPIADSVSGVRVRNQGMPVSQVVTYSIGAFIATLILTLGALTYFRANGRERSQTFNTPVPQSQPPATTFTPPVDSQPAPDNFPSDPRPRNDEQSTDSRPTDDTAPDSNMDDNRPRIDQNEPDPGQISESKHPKKGSDDPIDLRGDDGGSKKDPAKKGDPSGDPLRGDDIH